MSLSGSVLCCVVARECCCFVENLCSFCDGLGFFVVSMIY